MIHFHQNAPAAITRYHDIFGGEGSNIGPPAAGAGAWSGRAHTIQDGTVALEAAPGVGNSYTMQVVEGAGLLGSSFTLTGSTVRARGTLNASVPVSASPTAGTGANALRLAIVGAPTAADIVWGFCYEDILDNRLAYFAFGDNAGSTQSDATARYMGFTTIDLTPTTTEATVRCVIPRPGTFNRIRFRVNTGALSTVTVTAMVNGIATSSAWALNSGSNVFVDDTVQSFHVNAGDTVSFRYQRTAGADTDVLLWAMIAFLAD